MTRPGLVVRLARGLGALAALLGLLGGIPAALWTQLGWPLPHALPTTAELGRALGDTTVPDEVLVNALAIVCWAAWATLAASVAVEAAAAVRGRAARRLPLAGPVQALAGGLVAAVLLAFVPAPPRAAAAPPSLAGALAAPQHVERPATPTVAEAAPPATRTRATPQAPVRRYTVRPRDTLWGIADRELGDPLRWPELYQHNRHTPQPDGTTLTDPDHIRAGWILALPTDIRTPPPAPRGHHAHEPPHGHRTHGGHPPAEEAAPTGAPEATTPTPTINPTASNQHTRPNPTLPATPDDDHPHHGPVPLPSGAIVGLTLAASIAAALTAARLHRRRRRRLGEPRPGLTHTDPLLTPAVRRLRRAAPTRPASHPDPAHSQQGATSPAATPTATPPAARPGHEPPRTIPGHAGVVPVGQQDEREVTVDLTAGGLALTGPVALDAARAIATTLLAGAPPDAAEVIVAGDALAGRLFGGAGPVPGLTVTADLHTALTRLEVELVHRLRLLDDHDAADVAAYLAVDPAEPLPTTILLADAPDPALTSRLAAVLTLGRRLGIGAALLGPAPGVTTVVLGGHGDVTAVDPEQALPALPGARAFTLSAAEARELLTVVAAGHGATAGEQSADPAWDPHPSSPPHVGTTAVVDAQAGSDRRPIRVDLLGPLRIHTDTEVRTGLRRKARELLAFLLLHPGGATRDTAIEALWPEIDPDRGAERAKTAVQNLRHTLRAAAGLDGATVIEWTGQRWRVNPDLVDCDVWRFQAALAAAGSAPDDPAKTAALERATAAYRGSLLEGADYDWAEPAREELRRQAADAAGRLAELRERVGDGDGALTALEAAAGWDPYNEELHQRIMRLQARLGRPDAVRRTYGRLQTRLAELDVEPDDATEHLLGELVRPAGTPSQRR
jgi:DNA-binding SARP family transcriptional activator/nucleoid-associated protein YgaU